MADEVRIDREPHPHRMHAGDDAATRRPAHG
jgi:hypothetical protein